MPLPWCPDREAGGTMASGRCGRGAAPAGQAARDATNLATPTFALRRTHTTTSGTGHAISGIGGHQRQPAARVRLAGPSNATRPRRGPRSAVGAGQGRSAGKQTARPGRLRVPVPRRLLAGLGDPRAQAPVAVPTAARRRLRASRPRRSARAHQAPPSSPPPRPSSSATMTGPDRGEPGQHDTFRPVGIALARPLGMRPALQRRGRATAPGRVEHWHRRGCRDGSGDRVVADLM